LQTGGHIHGARSTAWLIGYP